MAKTSDENTISKLEWLKRLDEKKKFSFESLLFKFELFYPAYKK